MPVSAQPSWPGRRVPGPDGRFEGPQRPERSNDPGAADLFCPSGCTDELPRHRPTPAAIGSGAVESAYRGQQNRFKRRGQFWTRAGFGNLAALKEARENKHWDELWFAEQWWSGQGLVLEIGRPLELPRHGSRYLILSPCNKGGALECSGAVARS